MLTPQLTQYMHSCILWLREFFKILPFDKYEPVLGPIRPRVIISKTPIELYISGIFRSKKNQTVHAVCFGAHAGEHSLLNDPCAIMKLKLLEPFVKKHVQSSRPQVVLHIFGFGKNNNLQYHSCSTNEIGKESYLMVEGLIKTMEMGHHFPVIPCHHKCPYKKDCFPSKNNE